MIGHIVIEKRLGETPLQALEAFQVTDAKLRTIPMTYAGRLDPMASGKLLILIGDECKKKDQYTKLDKEYEFEVMFGVSTDTGDVLGLPKLGEVKNPNKRELQRAAQKMIGIQKFPYPLFSSKTVEGKALFQHAHDGTVPATLPETTIRIYRLDCVSVRTISGVSLLKSVLEKIDTLKVVPDLHKKGSDFRKEEIIVGWRKVRLGELHYTIATFKAVVSSGTYIRSLASLIASALDTTGLAFSIHRTVIGRYISLFSRLGFWVRRYLS